MRNNAHKNIGEVMAGLKLYSEAKYHLTEVSWLILNDLGSKNLAERSFELGQTRRIVVRSFLRSKAFKIMFRGCSAHLSNSREARDQDGSHSATTCRNKFEAISIQRVRENC